MKKIMICLMLLGFCGVANAQSFKNLNALRQLEKTAAELRAQSNFLMSISARDQKDKRATGTCYALGTLKSSRDRLSQDSRLLGSYANQLNSYLSNISRAASDLARACVEDRALRDGSIEGARDDQDHNRDSRVRLARTIQQSADAIYQVVINGINN